MSSNKLYQELKDFYTFQSFEDQIKQISDLGKYIYNNIGKNKPFSSESKPKLVLKKEEKQSESMKPKSKQYGQYKFIAKNEDDEENEVDELLNGSSIVCLENNENVENNYDF